MDFSTINNKVEKHDDKNQKISKSEIKSTNPCIYVISCFGKYLLDEKLFILKSNNKVVISIDSISKKELFYDKNFYTIIHKINLENKSIGMLNLKLFSEDSQRTIHLNPIRFNLNTEILLFVDINICQNSMNELIKEDSKKKYVKILKNHEKFNIYYDYLNQENLGKPLNLKNNLVMEYLDACREDDLICYSNIIKAFGLAFGKKIIPNFLDKYILLDIEFDVVKDKKFDEILNLFIEKRDEFFEKNKKSFQIKKKNIDYKLALENFMIIYILMQDLKINTTKKQLINAKSTLIKLINNKKSLIKRIAFISNFFTTIAKVFQSSEKLSECMKITYDSPEDLINLNYENFKNFYQDLIIEQENINKYILDFSDIFKGLIEEQNNTEFLIDIKNVYSEELRKFPNAAFEKNINKLIHDTGIQTIYRGKYDNIFLIRFLKADCSPINKNFEVLKYFKIELMNENFFDKFNKNKIYSLFKENYLRYLEQFEGNIKDMKYFGLFFKLLPESEYKENTITFIIKWLKKYINTFDIDKCKNIKEELFIFFNIMFDNKLNNHIIDLIRFIKENIKAFSSEIFIFLLNQVKIAFNHEIIKILITNILFEYENLDYELNLDNINMFLDEVNINKQYMKIFLTKMESFSLKYDDFFLMDKDRFKLFELIMSKNKININDESLTHSIYWKNGKNVCDTLVNNFEKLNISYTQILQCFKIIGEDKFQERLNSVYKFVNKPGYEYKSRPIFDIVKKIFEDTEEKLKIIEKMEDYNIFISKSNENTISNNKKLLEYNKKIFDSTLDFLNSKQHETNFAKLINGKYYTEVVEEILKLRNSRVFLKLFNQVKIKESKYISETAIKEFNKFKKLFETTEQRIDKELKSIDNVKYLIDIGRANIEHLVPEINFMINYFDINYFPLENYLIRKLQIYIQNQSLFLVISGILDFLDIYSDIYKREDKEVSSFIDYIKSFREKLNMKDIITLDEFDQINKYLEEHFLISGYNIELFNKFFIEINKNPNCIKFIKNKKVEQMQNLKEFILETEQSQLKEEDINDLINVIKFFESQTSDLLNSHLPFYTLIKNILLGISKDASLKKSIFHYMSIYNYLELLLNKYLKGTDEIIKTLKFILDDSEWIIKLNDSKNSSINKYFLSCAYKNNRDIEKDINFNYIIIFERDLDSIFQKLCITKIPDIYKYLFDDFVHYYENIKQIINILNELYIKGYHNNFEIEIKINNSSDISKIDRKEITFDNILKYLSDLNTSISKKLIEFYEEEEYIRCFYPRQIISIYNNIINNNEENSTKIKTLLNTYFNNEIKNLAPIFEYDYIIPRNNDINDYCQLFTKINNYIYDQLNYNKASLEKVYEVNKIKFDEKPLHSGNSKNKIKGKERQYVGIFFRMSKINDINNQEIESLKIYQHMTFNFPINICFLYCSKNTSSDELKYFLLRSFFCQYYVLFCIINIELLNHTLRKEFIHWLKTYKSKYRRKMKSCLLLMFNDEELQSIILKMKNIETLPEFLFANNYFNFDKNINITLVSSKFCGYGKSWQIKNEKSQEIVNKKTKEKVNYIYFPIGGKFNLMTLKERIDQMPDTSDLSKKFAIHFDVTQTKDIEFLNEFFFKLIILRKYDIYTNKYFGNNVEMIIEIPNDFTNYIKEVKIFNLLNKLPFKNEIEEISQLNQSDDLLNVAKMLTIFENKSLLISSPTFQKELSNMKISPQDCKSIILKHIKNNNLKNPNLYQLNIFIKILSSEFNKLNNDIFKEIFKEDDFYPFISLLIKITRLFIISPYENLIKNQEINQKILNEIEEKKERNFYKQLEINTNSFSFDNDHLNLIVFNEDKISYQIISSCQKDDPEFKSLQKIYKLQANAALRSFKELSGEEIFENLLAFLDASKYFDTKEKRDKILGTYVYTPDNFIKVVLILMRIRMNIPVILMGETGCGKTKLIEMAFQLLNKGEKKLAKMNIHAGIQDEDIINFITNLNDRVKVEDRNILKQKENDFDKLPKEDKNAYLKSKSRDIIFSEYKQEINNRKIWIFFDEINTCNSMGLLTEIMCKNTMNGVPLDNRYIFIAACNPYRVSGKENFLLNVLYKKNQKKKSLVYTVNPLPLSLMNFVFNFGSLKPDDELAYIRNMVERTINKYIDVTNKKDLEKKSKFIKDETYCVSICHEFLKKNNDVSIVSLREVNRFNIFLDFFIKYLLDRKNKNGPLNYILKKEAIFQFYSLKTDLEIYYHALNLSLYICYYLRLPDKESRKELSDKLNKTKYFFDNDFLKIPEMEMNFLVKNFVIPEGIAKNNQLKENIFLLFFCIINKIPLIICGKPGRSKTLSFKILENSMRGDLSPTPFCKNYPELMSYKIQGSLNTTSEEILKIFTRGRNSQEKNPNKLWVIFMDEMGLAEISENNPLKVIHSELEQEKNKIAFVGISNWFIDASKMNRVIYNVVQDPDENDLIETGKEIAKSYEVNGENICQQYEHVLIKLSRAYYKYYTKKKNNNDNNQYFHGSRDFYNLIKSVIKDIIKYEKELNSSTRDKNELLNKICVNQIMRNFGGLEDSIKEFKDYFFENIENIIYLNQLEFKYDLMKCLKDNINDENSRYLLLINENNLSQEILNYIIEDICQDKNNLEGNEKPICTKYIFGSKFKSDKKNIAYSNEILKKIKYEMGTENTIILKDLDSVYPALYELFNQSYTYLDGKKFVYLGESQSLSLVNDKFKVIVMVDKDQIENQDPPFLNRFEKHIINYSNLLNSELFEISNEIFSTLNIINNYIKKYAQIESKFSIISQIDITQKLRKFTEFINEEEIKGLVYIGSIKLKKESKEDKINYKKSIIKFVLNKIVPYFSEELMILITKFGFKNENNFYYQSIYEIYSQNYSYSLKDYLEHLDSDASIVYTYTSILEDKKILDKIITNEKLKMKFSKYSIKEINISEITSQSQIEKEIHNFIRNDLKIDFQEKSKKNLLLIKFKEEELYKLNNITYLLNDYRNTLAENKIEVEKSIVIFIIYLKKDEKIKNNSISFISNYPQKLISNLNGTHLNFPEILISSNEEIIRKELIDMKYIIVNNINDIFRYFNFDILNYFEEENRFPFAYKLLENSLKSKYFQVILLECLLKLIKVQDEDFVIKAFREEICNKNSLINIYFMNELFDFVNNIFFINFRKMIIILENEHIMSTVLFNDKLCQNKIIKKYVDKYVSEIDNDKNKNFKWNNKNLNQKLKITFLYGRKLPFLGKIFYQLFTFISKNISSQFLEEDTYFFYQIIPDDLIHKKQQKYLKSLQNLNNKLNLEIKKYEIIFDILTSEEKELISSFFEDLLFSFIQRGSHFNKDYIKLSKLLNLMIQLRMKTRINNKLGIDDIDKNLDISSFIDLIENEIDEKVKDEINEDDEEIKNKSDKQNIFINHFLSIIIFMQSYSKEIYLIMDIYYFLLSYIPDLYEKILLMIKNKEISMDNNDKDIKNTDYIKVNKASFFYIIEPICKIIKQNICNILLDEKIKNQSEKQKYIKLVQSFNYNLLKLEKRFMFNSNEIFYLDILIKIITKIELILKNPKQLNEAISIVEDIFNKIEDKINKMVNLYHILLQYLGEKSEEFGKIMNDILLNIYNSEKNNTVRNDIVRKILIDIEMQSNIHQLQYRYPILNKIFLFYSIKLSNPEQHLFESFETDNELKKLIDLEIGKKKCQINDIILYRFEILFADYFKKIKNDIIKDTNLKKFLIDATNVYYEKNNINIKYKTICELFAIAYIKSYLNYLADILIDKEKFHKFSERKEVFQILYESNWDQKKNCLIYYFMKILYKKFKTWEEFKSFYENNKIDNFIEYFKIINLNEDTKNFFCSPALLIDINQENDIDYNRLLFKDELKSENVNLFEQLFLKDNLYEYLYTFLANIKILYYSCDNRSEKKMEFMNLKNDIMKYLNEKQMILDKDILVFINLFFDENNFESIKEKIGFDKIDYEHKSELLKKKITILYNSMRFVFSALIRLRNRKSKEKLIYANLISKNISFSSLDKTYIPGHFINTSLKIESFYEIKPVLKENPIKYGAYMCSCGYYYNISGCTFPTKKTQCPKCGQYIGGEKYKLIKRNGHIRIFLDEKSRDEIFKKPHADKDVAYKYLSDLEIEIEEEKRKLQKGLKPIDKKIFLKKEEKVRDMNDITYRFLNFILYSFIFYGYINGAFDEKYLGKYVIKKMTIFEIMETDWDIMQNILEKLPIETFMNAVFDKIMQKIEGIPIFDTEEKAVNFEKEINEIVLSTINDQKMIEIYKQKNDNILKINPESSRVIIQEEFPYHLYNKKEYPNFDYFYISELPNKEHFFNIFNSKESNKEKYPIINTILNDKDLQDKLELMKYLPKINELCNYMINFVSFRYSREEANSKLIKDEIIDKDKINLIKEFIPIYKQFRAIVKSQGCHDFYNSFLSMEYDELNLGDLCVDSAEKCYGLVLYAMYEEMIVWQNKFINIVISKDKAQIKIYKDLFDIKINIQDCEEDQILNLPKFDEYISNKKDNDKSINSFDLLKTVLDNSNRKENKVIYNFEEIEDSLAAYILPKIKSFKSEIRRVTYQYECYLGNRNSIIIDFIDRYKQRELNDAESKGLINCILLNEKSNKFDTKNILFSFFILIDIILEESPDINTTIYSIIISHKSNYCSNMIKDFFNTIRENIEGNPEKYFTIDCLISLMEILEIFCWKNIRNNMDQRYLKEISDDIKVKFEQNLKIDKVEFCSAIRKFVSRFLSGKSDENIGENKNLENYLVNQELWSQNVILYEDIDEFENTIKLIFSDLDIKVSQAVKLYDYLGGDEIKLKNIINKYKKNIDENKENDKFKEDKYLDIENNINNDDSDDYKEEDEKEEDDDDNDNEDSEDNEQKY